jgi:hypothetical protein
LGGARRDYAGVRVHIRVDGRPVETAQSNQVYGYRY